MLLYTIMPYESVFPPQAEMKTETRPIQGGFVELLKTPDGYQVSRLISTNPQMYLGGMAPGSRYSGSVYSSGS